MLEVFFYMYFVVWLVRFLVRFNFLHLFSLCRVRSPIVCVQSKVLFSNYFFLLDNLNIEFEVSELLRN